MAAADKVSQIFISPVVSDPVDVLAILVHEMVHAVNQADTGETAGHGKVFSAIAKPLGLEGKMTATVAGAELRAYLEDLVEHTLGEFPHSALLKARATTKSRSGSLVKLVCQHDEMFKVSISKTALNYGPPLCPCHHEEMEEA